MSQSLTCPNPAELQQLAQGELTEMEAGPLEEHVLACSTCAERLSGFIANDPVLAMLPHELNPAHAATPTVDALIERLAQTPLSNTSGEARGAGARQRDSGSDTGVDRRARDAEKSSVGGMPVIPGYEVFEEMARGGQAIVFKARHIRLDRLVALKMMRGGAAVGTEEHARFRREAEAVARLKHPNIVQIHDIGEAASSSYLALEFVSGGTLKQKIATAPQSPEASAALLETLARAMHWAHERGIIHRDLKPHNVLMTEEGTPKIADFGISKRLDQDAGQTSTGAILGTPAYMAPEQAAGGSRSVGRAADIYSLGAILYELLAGRLPFSGENHLEILDKVRYQEPEALSAIRRGMPHDLETICLKCLRKEPSRRYATAADLAEDLRRFLAREPILARPVGAFERACLWARRRPVIAAMLASIVLLLVAGSSVSVYFAVAAAKEARNAERSATEAHRREIDARLKEKEANDAKAELEQTLARSLLKPFIPQGEGVPLNPIEIDTLWEIATIRNDSVRRLFLELPLEKAETAWQLTARRKPALRVAIGLDERRRAEFAQFLRRRLESAPDARIKQACIILGLALGGDVSDFLHAAEPALSASLPLIEGMTFVPALWAELGQLPHPLPPEEAELVARLALKIGVNGGYINPQLIVAPSSPYARSVAVLDRSAVKRLVPLLHINASNSFLLYAPLIPRLDSDQVQAIADSVIHRLEHWDLQQRMYAARILVVLAPRLRPADALAKLQTVSRDILKGNELQAGRISPNELPNVIEQILQLLPLLDEMTRRDAASQLAKRVTSAWDEVRGDAFFTGRVIREYGRIAPFLDPDSLAPAIALLSERMAKDPTDHWYGTHEVYREAVVHLDAARLELEAKAAVKALDSKEPQAFFRLSARLRTVFAIARRLKPPQAHEVNSAASRVLTHLLGTQAGFSNALAELFRDVVGELDDSSARALASAAMRALVNPHSNYFGNAALAAGYLRALDRLPADDAPLHARLLAASLRDEAAPSPYAARECSLVLVAVARRLPPSERDELLASAAGDLRNKMPQVKSPDVMASFQEAARNLGYPFSPREREVMVPLAREAVKPNADRTITWHETTRTALCDLAATFDKREAAYIAGRMTVALNDPWSRPTAQSYRQLLAALDREDSSRLAEEAMRNLLDLPRRTVPGAPTVSSEHVAALTGSLTEFLTDQQLADFLKMPDPLDRAHRAVLEEFARRRDDTLSASAPTALLAGGAAASVSVQHSRRFPEMWDFVQWATTHRPDVDLLLPPRH